MGVPRIWEGGAKNFFLRFWNLHGAQRHAAHGEAMRFARGIQGHAPPKNFFKMVWLKFYLVRFGVYLDPIFDLKKFHKVPFYIYIFFKLPFFYINF